MLCLSDVLDVKRLRCGWRTTSIASVHAGLLCDVHVLYIVHFLQYYPRSTRLFPKLQTVPTWISQQSWQVTLTKHGSHGSWSSNTVIIISLCFQLTIFISLSAKYHNQKNPPILSHIDSLYWHPMALPLPRVYPLSRRLPVRPAAADVPVDLFDSILAFIEVDWRDSGYGKRDLGSIALVCRRWAKICQQKIFQRIVLRSRQDFYEFRSFIVRPESVIPQSLEHLELFPTNFVTSPPWIHLICKEIPSQILHPDFSVVLRLESENGSPLVLSRSIHASLPIRLPIFSSGIRELTLFGIPTSRASGILLGWRGRCHRYSICTAFALHGRLCPTISHISCPSLLAARRRL